MVRWVLFYPRELPGDRPQPARLIYPIWVTAQKMVRTTGLEPEQGCPH